MSDQSAIDAKVRSILVQNSLGNFQEAESLCEQLTCLAPDRADAWLNLGVLRTKCGKLTPAIEAFRQAATLEARNAEVWRQLTAAYIQQGNGDLAEQAARTLIPLDEQNAGAWFQLGNSLVIQGKWKEAARAFEESLRIESSNGLVWSNLAVAEQKSGNLSAAAIAYEKSLELFPKNLKTIANYGLLLVELGQPTKALEILRPALVLDADAADAWIAAGHAFQALEQLPQAEQAYRQVLQLTPQRLEAMQSLASVLRLQSKFAECETLNRHILTVAPNSAAAWSRLASLQQGIARSDEAIRALQHCLTLVPSSGVHSDLLASLQYRDGISPQELLDAHRAWDATHTKGLRPLAPRVVAGRRDRPLRIGLLSSHFGQHPVGFLVLPAMEQLDRTAGELFCYNDRIGRDEYTERFHAIAYTWRDTSALSSRELAERIRADEIDILFDLMGHTSERLLTFALRPARVQISWLGYVGTTGMTAMDFLLADRFHIAPGEEQFYVENVLRMPNGYACYGPPKHSPAIGPLPALSSGHVTFGCFNNPAKFSREILDAWAEILRRVPTSRLLLRYQGLDDPLAAQSISQHFRQRAIDPARINLGGTAKHLELLAMYNRVDIALDTQPYSGGLTTCEALWMGVPVITFPGKTFAGRHSTSHLTNAGYPQFVAENAAGYVDLAVQWASRLPELAETRHLMRDRVRQSPLCDATRFADDLLDVLRIAIQTRADFTE